MINLEKLANGAVAEKFNLALKEVLANIADPNTDFAKKRKLTVELTFQSDDSRELSMVDIVTKTKLVPAKPVSTKVLIDRDGNGGIVASEYQKQVKGQQYMRVDEETGEILEDKAEQEGVDLKGIKLVK